jgi:two-component system phosphate regulon sensor histidine kinase PhoR
MRVSVHAKITGLILLVVVLVLSAIFFFLQKSFIDLSLSRIHDSMQKETALATALIEAREASRTRIEEYDDVAVEIGAMLKMRSTIIARDGRVLGDSEIALSDIPSIENHADRPEVKSAFESGYGESRRFSTTIKRDLFYSARTFSVGSDKGILRLALPLSDVEIIERHIRLVLIVSLFIAFLVAIVFSFISSRVISRPIKEMAYMAKSISLGNFSRKIRIHTNDEIEDLAHAFNNMAKQIQARIKEVTAHKVQLEAILHSMFDGLMVVDNKGIVVMVNSSLKTMLQIEQDPFGKKPIEVIRNVDIQAIVDALIEDNEGVLSQELSLLSPHEKTFMIHASPVIRDGATDGAVLVFHDITEIKHLETIRRDFVANVSHELRTPLSTIKGYAETLLDGALTDATHAHEFVKIIYDDANRLALLVNDLLDLSKIESGKFTLYREALSLKPLVERVVAGLMQSAEEKKIELVVNIPDSLDKVYVDEQRISQVLLNLIDNAIKYTLPGGRVRIDAAVKDNYIEVDIEDTGIGIPEADLPRIYERFYRVNKGRSRTLGGTGLGLSIVKHIVQCHGGNVFVESVLAKGSTFSFTIPKA